MKRLALFGLLALTSCGDDEPIYSAIICLEDRNKEHLIEKDFTRLFEKNGYEVSYPAYHIGMNARKFWVGHAYLSFSVAGDTKAANQPSMITTHLYLDSDDPLVTEYRSLIEEKWGGYERPGRTYSGNECESRDPETNKVMQDTVLVP